MVRARRLGSTLTITVFTDDHGDYQFVDMKPGEYYLYGSKDSREATPVEVNLNRSAGPYKLTLATNVQAKVSGAQVLSAIPDTLEKRKLVQNCVMCHAVGVSGTQYAGHRSPDFWRGAIQRMQMQHDAILTPDFDRSKQALLLAKYVPADDTIDLPVGLPPMSNVQIYEFDAPHENWYPHDIGLDSKSRIWVADYWNDFLEMLDPKTEQWKFYPIPVKKAGAHSIIQGPDGKMWLVLNIGNHIASFDPRTEQFKLYPVPGPGKREIGPRPHTEVFDSKGRLWFTEIGNNTVTRFDPGTGQFTKYPLFEEPKLFRDSFWLWPYGIALDAQDNIYYAKLGGNRIGQIDAASGKVKEWDMPEPYSGPRRLDTDSKGNVWIPAFTTGKLFRFDPHTETFQDFLIPTPNSTPYALYVDKKKDQVWICEASANKIGLFDIASQKWSEVLLPSQFGYTRKIDQDPNTGMLWISYSQMMTDHNKVVGIRFIR